ncbi:unnamed protein product [Musa textilis]
MSQIKLEPLEIEPGMTFDSMHVLYCFTANAISKINAALPLVFIRVCSLSLLNYGFLSLHFLQAANVCKVHSSNFGNVPCPMNFSASKRCFHIIMCMFYSFHIL